MAILYPERLDSGVRRRADGAGSCFGNLHRERLPRGCYCCDIDAMLITENHTFAEYCVSGRRVAFAAFIDAKATAGAAELVPLRRLVMCNLARAVAGSQPAVPLCFELIGQCEPFVLYQLNLISAARTGLRWYLHESNWAEVWNACGVTSVRDALNEWLMQSASESLNASNLDDYYEIS